MLQFISNSDHFKEVLSRVQSVKHMLWVGTADIKDLYLDVGNDKKPFLALIAQLIRRGVEEDLYMPRSLGQTSGRTLTGTLYCMIAWSECFVRVFILRCLSLTVKRCILAAQTSLVPASV